MDTEEAGKRVRRRRTADLTVSASSAETDMSSSVDNMMIRRMETASRQSPQPAADLRAHLRKTSQPPAFIRPVVPEIQNTGDNAMTTMENFSSPHPSVPWRTGKVASADKPNEPNKTEDLTARIEALTAMAHQTVAKVDRLTATPDRESNGVHPANAGSVKAVTTKLLNRVANIHPTTPASQNLPVALPRRPAKIESPNVCVNSNSSPALKLLPAAACTQQQQQTQSLSKNRPAVNPTDKTAAASPAGVAVPPVRANTANASPLSRNKTADKEKTHSKPAEPVGNASSGPSSSVKAVQGILKKKVEGAEPSVRIRPEVSAPELYPILWVEEETVTQLDPVSILKKRFEDTETSVIAVVPPEASVEPHSILKRPLSRDGSAESARSQSPVDPINSILKRASLTSSSGIPAPDQVSHNSEPRPILKKRCSTEEPVIDGPRPILKKKSSTEEEHEAAHRPILKSGRKTPQFSEATAQVTTREAETTDEPEEELRTEGLEPRQLSIAERISSIESQTNPPAVAPWRLASRPNPITATPPIVSAYNSVDFGAESITQRRFDFIWYFLEKDKISATWKWKLIK